MSTVVLTALLAYAASLALIIPGLLRRRSAWRRLAMFCAVIALINHGLILESRLFPAVNAQNFSLINISSLISLIVCTIMTVVGILNRGWLLLPIVYGFALLILLFVVYAPGNYITHLETAPGMMAHIGLALFAYSTLLIAALYALQLAWIDYRLKHKKPDLGADMPPLLAIERKMFIITQVGVVLLTLALANGLFYFTELLKQHLADKALFAFIAWWVYVLLLWGHWHKGWRGRRVVWFNVSGVLLLTLAYFGSHVARQFTG